jgi:DNA-binding CsgD family transcriptional regulator
MKETALRRKTMTKDKALEHLIGVIYETALDPSLWPEVMTLCARQVDGIAAHIMTVDKHRQSPTFLVAAGDGDLSARENQSQYLNYYVNIDPRMQVMATAKLHEWRYCTDHLDQKYVNHNEFYQDFLLPSGGRYAMGAWIDEGSAEKTVLGLHRHQGQPLFGAAERQVAAQFSGHLQRSIRLQKHTLALQDKAMLGARAIDTLNLPMLIVDAKATIRHLNLQAEILLQNSRRSGFSSQNQRLSALHPDDNQKLATLIAQATSVPAQGGATFLCHGAQQAFVTPLSRESSFANEWRINLALLVILESGKSISSLPLLGKLYNLSPAELKCAAALLAGQTADAYAQESGLARNTVRTQIKNLLRKTATVKQSDLLALLSRSPPLAD